MERTITLDEIGERSASDLLRDVAHGDETWRVVLDTGGVLTITPPPSPPPMSEPAPQLRPLPQFEGTIPDGWKNAIYDFTDAES